MTGAISASVTSVPADTEPGAGTVASLDGSRIGVPGFEVFGFTIALKSASTAAARSQLPTEDDEGEASSAKRFSGRTRCKAAVVPKGLPAITGASLSCSGSASLSSISTASWFCFSPASAPASVEVAISAAAPPSPTALAVSTGEAASPLAPSSTAAAPVILATAVSMAAPPLLLLLLLLLPPKASAEPPREAAFASPITTSLAVPLLAPAPLAAVGSGGSTSDEAATGDAATGEAALAMTDDDDDAGGEAAVAEGEAATAAALLTGEAAASATAAAMPGEAAAATTAAAGAVEAAVGGASSVDRPTAQSVCKWASNLSMRTSLVPMASKPNAVQYSRRTATFKPRRKLAAPAGPRSRVISGNSEAFGGGPLGIAGAAAASFRVAATAAAEAAAAAAAASTAAAVLAVPLAAFLAGVGTGATIDCATAAEVERSPFPVFAAFAFPAAPPFGGSRFLPVAWVDFSETASAGTTFRPELPAAAPPIRRDAAVGAGSAGSARRCLPSTRMRSNLVPTGFRPKRFIASFKSGTFKLPRASFGPKACTISLMSSNLISPAMAPTESRTAD
mmetsp:Transcript_98960/g.255853  ORF Transcript_98960/g.255853 Transcript_98960/m.255853 type:complete len:565 (-) Transcript_98960:134-1828(-)